MTRFIQNKASFYFYVRITIKIMDAFKNYILHNWILILILAAFAIVLGTTGFMDKKATRRLYVLIGVVFALSISVFMNSIMKPNLLLELLEQY